MGFIGGFSLVLISLGAAATLAGAWLIAYRGPVQRIGGVLIILFGLYLIGLLRVPFLLRQIQLPLSLGGRPR